MSLKDKAVIFDFSVLFSQIQQGKTLHKTEQYVKLSDAEEEIDKIIVERRKVIERNFELAKLCESKHKEIQTLVKLLAESKFTLNDCQSELKEMGYSEEGNTLKSVKKIKERITQTLKNYEK